MFARGLRGLEFFCGEALATRKKIHERLIGPSQAQRNVEDEEPPPGRPVFADESRQEEAAVVVPMCHAVWLGCEPRRGRVAMRIKSLPPQASLSGFSFSSLT